MDDKSTEITLDALSAIREVNILHRRRIDFFDVLFLHILFNFTDVEWFRVKFSHIAPF